MTTGRSRVARREKAQRRAVLRFEGAEGARRGAERTEDDRDAGRADAPRAKELVAQRRVAVARARQARSRGASRRELALDGVVDRVGEPSAERRADALELDHDHPGHAERRCTRRRAREPSRTRGARVPAAIAAVRAVFVAGAVRERPRLRAGLSHPDVVHGFVDRG